MKRVVGGLVTFGIIMAFYNSFSAGGPVITVDAPRATTPTQKREIPETKPLIESPTMDDYRNKFKEYEQEQDQRIEKSK